MFRKRLFTFGVIVVFLGIFGGLNNYFNRVENVVNTGYVKESILITRVIDGDTLESDNETIRLLGIDNREV